MDLSALNLATAGESAIIVAVSGVLTQVIKKTGKVSSNLLPLVSLVVGLLSGIIAVAVTKDTNYAGGAIYGALLGASTSGLVDLGTGTATTISTAVTASKDAKQAQADAQAKADKEAEDARIADTVQKALEAQASQVASTVTDTAQTDTATTAQTQSDAVSDATDKGVTDNAPQS